jgi:anti-anti-sigma factor
MSSPLSNPRRQAGCSDVLLAEGVVTPVAALDGAVIATVVRRLERPSPEVPGADPLLVVAVDGELDMDSAPVLEDLLVQSIDGWARVCCDLQAVRFFGAAGANAVLAAHQHAAAKGHAFGLRGVHGITRCVLTAAGLDHTIPVEG